MLWGFVATYFVLAIAYGGFLGEPAIVQVVVFGLTGGTFAAGAALVVVGSYPVLPPHVLLHTEPLAARAQSTVRAAP